MFIYLESMARHNQSSKVALLCTFITFFESIISVAWLNPIYMITELYYEREYNVRKSLVICTARHASDLLFKILKHFEIMLSVFECLHIKEIVET